MCCLVTCLGVCYLARNTVIKKKNVHDNIVVTCKNVGRMRSSEVFVNMLVTLGVLNATCLSV